MRRREFLSLLGGMTLTLPLAARGQQLAQAKIARVGWLGLGSSGESDSGIDAFEGGLRDLGYTIDNSILLDYRFADRSFERLPGLAAELIRLPVDVIFAPTTAAAVAASKATKTIPIVFANVRDPVVTGLVDSLARPNRNVTGLAWEASSEIVGKQLQYLRQLRPTTGRLAVLWNPDGAVGNARALATVMDAARSLNVELVIAEVRTPTELSTKFQKLVEQRIQGVLILADVMLFEQRAILSALALEHGLPTMFGSRQDMAAGLMAYGANRLDLIRSAAGIVHRILKGAWPGDIPVEQPTRFELVINLKTAKTLGITVPESLIARADELIE